MRLVKVGFAPLFSLTPLPKPQRIFLSHNTTSTSCENVRMKTVESSLPPVGMHVQMRSPEKKPSRMKESPKLPRIQLYFLLLFGKKETSSAFDKRPSQWGKSSHQLRYSTLQMLFMYHRCILHCKHHKHTLPTVPKGSEERTMPLNSSIALPPFANEDTKKDPTNGGLSWSLVSCESREVPWLPPSRGTGKESSVTSVRGVRATRGAVPSESARDEVRKKHPERPSEPELLHPT